MSLDILRYYRSDLYAYQGFYSCYVLYLPYTEENIELYEKYLEYQINRRIPNDGIIRKIKI